MIVDALVQWRHVHCSCSVYKGPSAVPVLAVPALVFGVDRISMELASSLTSYWRGPSNPSAFRRHLIEDSLRKF